MMDDIDREVCSTIGRTIVKALEESDSLAVHSVEYGDPSETIIVKAKSDAWKWRATVKIEWGENK